MSTSEEELKRIHRLATTPATRTGCLSSSDIAAAALGESPSTEIVDHLADCALCAREFQAVSRAARDVRAQPARPSRWLAIAATIAIVAALGGVAGALLMRERAMTARLDAMQRNQQQLRSEMARQLANMQQLERQRGGPMINVPVVDLEPRDAVLRGSAPSPAVVLPPAAGYTFILGVNPGKAYADYEVEIVRASGPVVWSSTGLRRSHHHTFTMTVPQSLLPSGEYRINLYGVDGSGRPLIESYTIRVPA